MREEHVEDRRDYGSPSVPGADIEEFGAVLLTKTVDHMGVAFPAGTRGVVVHDHGDGSYEIEFSRPAEHVITLTRDVLKAA